MNYKYRAWILVFIWCICIFAFSSDNADQSSHKSKAIVKKVVHVAKIVSNDSMEINMKRSLEYYIRKLAHMSEYFILASLLCNALKHTTLRIQGQIIYAILFLLIYASLDEYHQTFVPGRDGKVLDVFIDMCGGIIGIYVYNMVRRFKEKRV